MAVGGLLQHQLEAGHRAFERCADRFERFARADSRARFKALWHADAPEGPTVEEPTAPDVPAVAAPPLPPPPPLPAGHGAPG
jgi:hypothetical protein